LIKRWLDYQMWTIPAMQTNLFHLLRKPLRFKSTFASPTLTGLPLAPTLKTRVSNDQIGDNSICD
jgi:hypothetical protein